MHILGRIRKSIYFIAAYILHVSIEDENELSTFFRVPWYSWKIGKSMLFENLGCKDVLFVIYSLME